MVVREHGFWSQALQIREISLQTPVGISTRHALIVTLDNGGLVFLAKSHGGSLDINVRAEQISRIARRAACRSLENNFSNTILISTVCFFFFLFLEVYLFFPNSKTRPMETSRHTKTGIPLLG